MKKHGQCPCLMSNFQICHSDMDWHIYYDQSPYNNKKQVRIDYW